GELPRVARAQPPAAASSLAGPGRGVRDTARGGARGTGGRDGDARFARAHVAPSEGTASSPVRERGGTECSRHGGSGDRRTPPPLVGEAPHTDGHPQRDGTAQSPEESDGPRPPCTAPGRAPGP